MHIAIILEQTEHSKLTGWRYQVSTSKMTSNRTNHNPAIRPQPGQYVQPFRQLLPLTDKNKRTTNPSILLLLFIYISLRFMLLLHAFAAAHLHNTPYKLERCRSDGWTTYWIRKGLDGYKELWSMAWFPDGDQWQAAFPGVITGSWTCLTSLSVGLTVPSASLPMTPS